jgi:hypothetical protein
MTNVSITCQYLGKTETINVPKEWYDWAIKFDQLEDAMHTADEDNYFEAESAYVSHSEKPPVPQFTTLWEKFNDFCDVLWASTKVDVN